MDKITMPEVMQSILQMVSTKNDYDKAYEKYEGHSWDYHEFRLIEELRESEEDACKITEKYIKQIVKEVLINQKRTDKE